MAEMSSKTFEIVTKMTSSSMQQAKPLQAVSCKFPEPNKKQAQ